MSIGAIPCPSVGQIILATCEVIGVSQKDLVGRSRISKLAFARQAAAYVAREFGHNPKATGQAMNRDRSTMIHDAAVFEADLAKNADGDLLVIMEDIRLHAVHQALISPEAPPQKGPRPRAFKSEADYGTQGWHQKNDARFRAGLRAARKTGSW